MTDKLHIGCGKVYIPDFVNVDIFSSVYADVYADMTALPFDRETFSLVYASHVLEHAHRHMVLATLSHWRDLLKPGGVLRIAVPDFGAVVQHYHEGGKLSDLMGLLYGGQNHPKNHHFVTFDHASLRADLNKVGFKETRPWDWKDTEHASFDDYSQAFLPHLKRDGRLMSLNMEAVK
jgi:predicted SAM-dependent methyltransferase